MYYNFTQNILALHQEDGEHYRYIGKKIIEIDAFNPQVAARLAKLLGGSKKLDQQRASKLKAVLKDILGQEKLSTDTLEVVSTNLAQ